MAKPEENREEWRTLFAKCEIRGDDRVAFPAPTADELDRFESEAGAELPAGYRGFIQVFGPGGFVFSRYNIFLISPCCPAPSRDLMRSYEKCARLKTEKWMDERVRRLVVFARNGLGHEFGWDPHEVTDPSAPECAIYAWYRDNQAVKMSNTFRGFLKIGLDTKACLEHLRRQVYHEDAAESDLSYLDTLPRRVYQRAEPALE